MFRYCCGLLGLVLGAAPAFAANPVALVEDVEGKAPVQLMDYLAEGQRIELPPDARVVIGYFGSCERETIEGERSSSGRRAVASKAGRSRARRSSATAARCCSPRPRRAPRGWWLSAASRPASVCRSRISRSTARVRSSSCRSPACCTSSASTRARARWAQSRRRRPRRRAVLRFRPGGQAPRAGRALSDRDRERQRRRQGRRRGEAGQERAGRPAGPALGDGRPNEIPDPRPPAKAGPSAPPFAFARLTEQRPASRKTA